jgi:flagellar basal-body rod protein FlgB
MVWTLLLRQDGNLGNLGYGSLVEEPTMGHGNAIDRTVALMQDRLNLNTLNHKVISSNLANINTPRYVARHLSFEQTLRETLEEDVLHLVRTRGEHMDPADVEEALREPQLVETGPVDLDSEMARLAQNSVEYQFIVTMLNKKFALIKAVLEGGR